MDAKKTLGKMSDEMLLDYARDWANGVKFATRSVSKAPQHEPKLTLGLGKGRKTR